MATSISKKEVFSLGDRMKSQELKYQSYISDKENVIIRLDGDSFSKFTKDLRKPFDEIFVNTMIETTKELFKQFTCSFAYTQSDEITLVIPSNSELVLGGKIQKLVSLTSGFCSSRFNYNFNIQIEKSFKESKINFEYYEKLKNKIGKAWFDSRVFAFEDKIEVFNAILWRMRDAERNSISMLCYSSFSHNEVLNKNSKEKKELLLSKNINWDDLDNGLKYGFYFKREKYFKSPGVERRKISVFSKKFNFSDENVDLIFQKEI